jgi:predicted ATP-grasp superfamily ATP-dependent carboligase
MLQEYIPGAEDWIVHAYCNARSELLAVFTGAKYRSWPPGGGVTTYARVVANERLVNLAATLCAQIGYRGLLDLDVRYDARDDEYKVVDFNPRVGAQFRLFETDAGIDVVRAMHLDLTGRPLPSGTPCEGRGFVVEHLDVAAMLAGRRVRRPEGTPPHPGGPTELAWFARDDPMPFMAMMARVPSLLTARVRRRLGSTRP